MPLNVTLVDLRRDLRAEVGQTLNPAQGVQAQSIFDNQLDRQQRELWQQYDWPHLRYWIDVPVSSGQAIYSYPSDMPFDSVNRIRWSDGSQWRPLAYGLHGYDLRPGAPQTGTPVRWGNVVTVTAGKTDPIGQIELVPVPNADGVIRFDGQAPCNPLVADTDRCIIDSKAIVLLAAAEIMAIQKVEAAQLKLLKAQNYIRGLLRSQGADKRVSYNMGGSSRASGFDHYGAGPYNRNYQAVPGIDYIPS